MNEPISGILRKLLVQYGTELLSDRRRLEGLLLDRCAGERKEIGLLLMAAKENIPEELLATSGQQLELPLFNRWVKRLCDDVGIDEGNARRTVETWAEALGFEPPAIPAQPVAANPAPTAAPTASAASPPVSAAAIPQVSSAKPRVRIALIGAAALLIAAVTIYFAFLKPQDKELSASPSSAVSTESASPAESAPASAEPTEPEPSESTAADAIAAEETPTEENPIFPFYAEGGGGYMDGSGNVVVEPKFDSVSPFREGLAVAAVNGKEGFIDKSGEWVIPAQYEVAFPFAEGYARVMVKNRFVFIDQTGKIVIDGDIGERATGDAYFSEGLLAVSTGDLIGYVDKTGATVIEPQFEFAGKFHDGLAIAEKDDKRFYIDKSGAVAIPNNPDYYFTGDFAEGMSQIEAGANQYGFIDTTGKVVIPPNFEFTLDFSEGVAAAKSGGQTGYIDKSGDWVIPPQFDYAGHFHEGMASMRNAEMQWGYINRQGEIVVPYSLDTAGDYHNGLAWAGNDEDLYYLDKSGQAVRPIAPSKETVGEQAIAGMSRYHDSLRGTDGKSYDFYLFADDESSYVEESPSAMANEGDVIYSGRYKAAVGQKGELQVRMLTENGEEPFSFNASRDMIGKLRSSGANDPDVLVIRQYGSSNGDILTFYVIDGGDIAPLTLRYDESNTSPDLFASEIESQRSPMTYRSSAYDNSVGEWHTYDWKLDVLHRELIRVATL